MTGTSPVPAYLLWLGPTGLSVARALGRAGIEVIAAHHDANEPSVDTRYARTVILPPLETNEPVWLDWLIAEGRERSPTRSVLIAASDAHWIFISKHREALAPYFRFANPPGDP